MKSKLLIALAATLTLPACATITRGTSEAWEVQTTPAGARVETSNGHVCASTPCAIRMSREAEFTATITKDGFEPVTVTVTHQTAGAGAAGMAGNVILGGVIGAVVDANTGATQELTPNPVILTLSPLPSRAAGGGENLVDRVRDFFVDLF